MRIADLAGRCSLVSADGALALDVERAGDGRLGADPQAAWRDLDALRSWADGLDVAGHPGAAPFDAADLRCPVPAPSQVLAIGLNYADHAAEAGMTLPEHPMVFTKFASSLTGARATVALSGDRVDWEAELVLVVGTGGRDVPAASGWDHVAALTVGQDLSDRTVQQRGCPAQFSMGKSFAGYSPVGPWATTVDEVRAGHDVDDLAISCAVTGGGGGGAERVLQDGRTSSMVFGVPQLVARLSAVVELRPGDLVFTGTPAGVGLGRDPQEFLVPGQVLTTRVEGLGEITQHLV